MAEKQTVKDRLILFIKHLGIGQGRFEKDCGLSNGYINNSKGNFGASKIDDILRAYPMLSREWLMTGSGEMLKKQDFPIGDKIEDEDVELVPLLPISAFAGSLSDFSVSVMMHECERIISPTKGADIAITVWGESMSPKYPNGSRVFIKRIDGEAFIEWGKAYVLDTCNGVVVKILVPSDREGYIRCVSINPNPIFASFEISKSDIYGIYRIILGLSVE